jgi:hypothetical protein
MRRKYSVWSQHGVHPVVVSPDPIYSVTFCISQSGEPHALSAVNVYIYTQLAAESEMMGSVFSTVPLSPFSFSRS